MTHQPENIPLTEISSVLFFILPMIVIIFQYVKMGVVINNTTNGNIARGLSGSVHGRNRKNQANCKNIIKMLSFVVLGFFACWCPFHAQRLISTYLRDYEFFDDLNYWMYISSGIFYYFSSTLNPILYNVMSERMRNAFKEVICGVKIPKRSTLNRTTLRDTSEILISNHHSNANECDELTKLVKDNQIMVYSQKIKGNLIKTVNDEIEYNWDETTI